MAPLHPFLSPCLSGPTSFQLRFQSSLQPCCPSSPFSPLPQTILSLCPSDHSLSFLLVKITQWCRLAPFQCHGLYPRLGCPSSPLTHPCRNLLFSSTSDITSPLHSVPLLSCHLAQNVFPLPPSSFPSTAQIHCLFEFHSLLPNAFVKNKAAKCAEWNEIIYSLRIRLKDKF